MNKRQVIIVGAGPGGSTTAFYLAKQGIDVLMLDRAVFPRHKPCGDVQIISNFHVFEDMGIMDDIKRVGQEDHGLVLIESTGEELYLESKTALAYVTPRYDIDDFTCKAAVKAGAELIENFDVRELIMERGVVKGVRGFLGDEYQEYYADITVLACGSHSLLSRSLGIFREDKNLIHYAARCYYENIEGLPEDATETYYLKDFSPNGYIWLSSLGGGRANVGVFLSEDALQKSGRKLEDWIPWWAENHPMGRVRLGNANMYGELMGWRIASSRSMGKNYAAGCLIVGDAGNMVESFQGEGYPQAIESAIIAADFIPRALAKGDVSERAMAPYWVATSMKINPTFWLMAALRASLFRKPEILTAAVKALNKIPNKIVVFEKFTDTLVLPILKGSDLSNLDWEKYEELAKYYLELDGKLEQYHVKDAAGLCKKTIQTLRK